MCFKLKQNLLYKREKNQLRSLGKMLSNRFNEVYHLLLVKFLNLTSSDKEKYIKEKSINLKKINSNDENIFDIFINFVLVYQDDECQILLKCTREDFIIVIIKEDAHIVFKHAHNNYKKIKVGYLINFDIHYFYEINKSNCLSYLKFLLL